MQLTGTVTLDDETMEDLKSQIREEVLKGIKKSGLYLEEVESICRTVNLTLMLIYYQKHLTVLLVEQIFSQFLLIVTKESFRSSK